MCHAILYASFDKNTEVLLEFYILTQGLYFKTHKYSCCNSIHDDETSSKIKDNSHKHQLKQEIRTRRQTVLSSRYIVFDRKSMPIVAWKEMKRKCIILHIVLSKFRQSQSQKYKEEKCHCILVKIPSCNAKHSELTLLSHLILSYISSHPWKQQWPWLTLSQVTRNCS